MAAWRRIGIKECGQGSASCHCGGRVAAGKMGDDTVTSTHNIQLTSTWHVGHKLTRLELMA